MADVKVLEATLDEDLRPLSLYLWQQGLPHRISEQSGHQIIWVASPEHAAPVREAYQRHRSGELPQPSLRMSRSSRRPIRFEVKDIPVTLVFIVLSVLGYLLVSFDGDGRWLRWLTFFEFERRLDFMNLQQPGHVVFSLPPGQYWRLITPIFLHFSLLHIVFNMLWFWDLGRRVERVQGSLVLLGITLLIGLGSNLAQAMFAQVGIFGGMSGVIYGLLGYCWAWSRLRRDTALAVPTPIMVMMLVWLVVCMVGFTELVGLGSVANAAHVGGLVMGLLLGAFTAWLARAKR